MKTPLVSIIITTQNRADSLQQTLASMASLCVPKGMPAEIIVVDNGSHDHTADVVRSCSLPEIPVRAVYEAQRGLSSARNAGIAASQGSILLWTDDDTRPPPHWIPGMCAPILEGRGQAVAGGIKLASDLERPWMDLWHRAWLASSECLEPDAPGRMIGANMAFSRDVLAKVPAFDPELGAGALGSGEETLFSRQLTHAGFTIVSAFEVMLEHHFDASRLTRADFLAAARKFGRAEAYIAHHWSHQDIPSPHRALARSILRRAFWQIKRAPQRLDSAPILTWEMQLALDISLYRHYLVERKRPRNYAQYGLVKLT